LLFALTSLTAFANAHRSDTWAHAQFAIAEGKREALSGSPVERQTRREYQDVIDSYRRVYCGSPTSTKADASVAAVAELMMEMGRRFHDATALRGAISEFEFLRQEYPGSKYRFEALLTIGQIYEDDLNDSERARETLEDFLRRYPRNHLADDARTALATLSSPTPVKTKESEANVVSSSNNDVRDPTPTGQNTAAEPPKLAHVTGIRHWSRPGHTMVAIDLDQEVIFSSQRLESPDRIFFDLDAKLARSLSGKIVDVNDDLLKKIRVAQFKSQRARIVLEVGEHSDFNASVETNPERLVIDLRNGDLSNGDLKNSQLQTSGLQDRDIQAGAIPSQNSHNSTDLKASKIAISPAGTSVPTKRIVEADDDADDEAVAKLETAALPPASPLSSKRKTTIKKTDATEPVTIAPPSRPIVTADRQKSRQLNVREAQPTASGDRSLIRALGLKIGKIVIDPGHGGHDTGTIGPNSLEEKDLVLDVSRRLGKLLESRLGAEVVYTRKDDTFIPLETRTAIANQEQADLFVSIHANSSHDPDARGVETYYLNFSSSPDALEVAARENAVSETSIHELQDLVKQIALKEKIEESREFAADVQQELHSGLAVKNPGLRDRGVKKAPFIVLIGANMPSILAEISFVSNPGDERRLETQAYRQKIAESLYRGISKYVNGLSGVKVASKIEKTSGQ
jgi:N-acetylmuramoyl-L-alanine amidase